MQINNAHYTHLESVVDLALKKQAEINAKDRNAFTQIMLWEKDMKNLLDEKANEGETSTQNGKQQPKKEEQYEQ